MAAKPSVLFVLFEGLADTVIDAQVLNHARDLARAGLADFEIWAVCWNEDLYARSLERQRSAAERTGGEVAVLRGVRPALPSSVSDNSATLLAYASQRGRKFTHVHARADYSVLPCVALAESMNATLIWDCRGDAVAEIDYRTDIAGIRSLLKPALRFLTKQRFTRAARACDRALFVSSPLHELAQPYLGSKPYSIVPSCASESDFFFSPQLREATRAKLGYQPNETLYVYSGGVQAYQRFEDMIAAFAALARSQENARLLIATPQVEAARKIAQALLPAGAWQALSVPISGVNALLNAADAGFLLRHDTPTNYVASPTKFAEYCLAGLPVILTNAIKDSFALAKRHGNLVAFDEAGLAVGALPVIDRCKMAQGYRSVLGKAAHLDTYRQIYDKTY
jgi:glycosyltransferase involved in cell wall biosynthesis